MRRTIALTAVAAGVVLLLGSALPATHTDASALSQETQPRTVLFEFFARTTCGICKTAGPVVDQLDSQYTRDNKNVIFVEHDVDNGSQERKQRWWQARTSTGSVTLPLVLVDSGFQWSNGNENFQINYRRMVDAALARPAGAELYGYYQINRSDVEVTAILTNRSSIPMGYSTRTTLTAMIYEDNRVIHTDRFVRLDKSLLITDDLDPDATGTYKITLENVRGINWAKAHLIVFADWLPPGSQAFDMLQVAVATEGVPPEPTTPPTPVPPPTFAPPPTATPTEEPPTPVPTVEEPTPTDEPPGVDIYLPITVRRQEL